MVRVQNVAMRAAGARKQALDDFANRMQAAEQR
jgi:hypothetical protein